MIKIIIAIIITTNNNDGDGYDNYDGGEANNRFSKPTFFFQIWIK